MARKAAISAFQAKVEPRIALAGLVGHSRNGQIPAASSGCCLVRRWGSLTCDQFPARGRTTFAGVGASLARLIIVLAAVAGAPRGHFGSELAHIVRVQPVPGKGPNGHIADGDTLSATVRTVVVTFFTSMWDIHISQAMTHS